MKNRKILSLSAAIAALVSSGGVSAMSQDAITHDEKAHDGEVEKTIPTSGLSLKLGGEMHDFFLERTAEGTLMAGHSSHSSHASHASHRSSSR